MRWEGRNLLTMVGHRQRPRAGRMSRRRGDHRRRLKGDRRQTLMEGHTLMLRAGRSSTPTEDRTAGHKA